MTLPAGVLAKARGVRAAIFDVDGVMTDGTLYLSGSGEEFKAFNTLDGHGLKMLQESGVAVAILTGRSSRTVETRARELGIAHLRQGAADKAAGLLELLAELAVAAPSACYMGDDVVDLPAMLRCGLKVTVPDAPDAVRQHADYVTRAAGGRGAVREVCDLLMQSHGTLEARIAAYVAAART